MRIIEREQRTAEQMIRIYCRYKEGNKELCPTCQQLLHYAHNRLEHCTFGEQKIGMVKSKEFDHPLVSPDHPLCRHVLYKISLINR